MEIITAKIENRDGKLVVSSRVIAEQLGKEHKHVLESLNKLILESQNLDSLIISSTYEVEGQNRKYKEYLLTEKGFTLYVMNIQGYNDFKLAYINEFERMKLALQNPLTMLLSLDKETLALTALQLTQQVQAKDNIILEQKQKVEYFDKVLDSSNSHSVTSVAKMFEMSAKGLNLLLSQQGVQFYQGGMWHLYAKYQDKGYTKTKTYVDNFGNTRKSLQWTEKGINFISDILEEC